jgi:hypothetical protein
MPFSTAVRLSLVLALLAVPADALGADTIRTSSVTGRLVVPSGSPSTIGLACPPGAVALNGAITRRGGGVVVQRSIPGKRGGNWAFRVAAGGSGSRSVSAVLRCISLRLPDGLTRARLNVQTQRRTGIVLAPGATATARAGCGSRWIATGYALSGGRRGDVRLAEVVPGAHGWRFTLENTGPSAARVAVAARCLRSKVTATGPGARSAELRFGVTRPAHSNTLGPNVTTFTHSCGGNFSLATGSSVDPAAQIELAASSPAGPAGGRWRFRKASGGDQVRSFLVCLSRASRFLP